MPPLPTWKMRLLGSSAGPTEPTSVSPAFKLGQFVGAHQSTRPRVGDSLRTVSPKSKGLQVLPQVVLPVVT